MTEEKEAEFPAHAVERYGPRCPTCAAFTRLAATMLDPVNGRTVRLYQCRQCGERIWNE